MLAAQAETILNNGEPSSFMKYFEPNQGGGA